MSVEFGNCLHVAVTETVLVVVASPVVVPVKPSPVVTSPIVTSPVITSSVVTAPLIATRVVPVFIC